PDRGSVSCPALFAPVSGAALQVLAGVYPAAGPGHPAFSLFWFYQVRQCNVFVSRVFGKMFQSGYGIFPGQG
ncbi:MAG TPA: hypothetical protein P5569_04340, partial [Candidatus Latescibacteria bacterium]|nr:hypothetical protein [Candidatus Latescibacterota bacterium]